jgi:hypothetical protein
MSAGNTRLIIVSFLYSMSGYAMDNTEKKIEKIRGHFDALIENAATSEARMIAEATRLQAELLNLRLGQIEHLLAKKSSPGDWLV